MSIRNVVALVFSGAYFLKEKKRSKAIAVIGLLAGLFIIYISAVWRGADASLWCYLSLAGFLFYLLSALDALEPEESGRGPVSDPYGEGRIAMMSLDYARAEKLFLLAMKGSPGDMDVVFQLGVLYCKRGDKKKSGLYIRKYLKQKKHTKWREDAERILRELS
jgi:hypothetical protein